MLSTFPGKKALKEESFWCLWNIIFNGGVESIDTSDWDYGILRYTSRNHLLTTCMETGESKVKFVRRQAALHVCLGISCCIMELDSTEVEVGVEGGGGGGRVAKRKLICWWLEVCITRKGVIFLTRLDSTTLKSGKDGFHGFSCCLLGPK